MNNPHLQAVMLNKCAELADSTTIRGALLRSYVELLEKGWRGYPYLLEMAKQQGITQSTARQILELLEDAALIESWDQPDNNRFYLRVGLTNEGREFASRWKL